MAHFNLYDLVEEAVINLTLNGGAFKINVQTNWTLDYVLRDKLGLTGTTEFCGQGACGACTVLRNNLKCFFDFRLPETPSAR